MTDRQFVDFAAQTDMVEANLGQLAQTAAASKAATLRTRQDWVPQVPVWDLGS